MGSSETNSGVRGRLRAHLGAWQPFTGLGLATFAQASFGRVLLFQATFASFTALTLVMSLRTAWIPVLEHALEALPATSAEIRAGQLHWPSTNATLLAAGPHLALAVDPSALGELGQNGDLQLEMRPSGVRGRGILGQKTIPYPLELGLPLDRNGATAAWGAWRLPLLAIVGLATALGLGFAWWLTGLLYAPLVTVGGWMMGRSVSWVGGWKLATAALLPASLLLDLGLALYAHYWLGLPALVAIVVLHWVAGWFGVAWGVACLPRRASKSVAPNPFDPETITAPPAARTKPRNPFDS